MKSTNLLSRTCIAMVLMTLATTTAIAQNQLIRTLKVADGTVNQTQSPDALIDMQSTSKGLLLPRVELTGTTAAAPLANHTAGMVVYNTVSAGSGGTAVSPGYYYNDGTQWIKISSGSAEVDGVIGNEVLNATSGKGLARAGSGTTASPYTLGLTDGTAAGQVMAWNSTTSTWAPATANSALATKDIVAGTSSATATAPITLSNASGQVVGSANASVTINNTAPLWNANQLQGKDIAATVPTVGQVLAWNATTGWTPTSPSAATEADGVIGNEVTNATTNGGLVRAGSGTAADPYTLGLAPGTANGQILVYNSSTSLWEPKAPSSAVNLYNTDGTLTGNRTVTQNANTLAFTSTATNGFSVDGSTFSVDGANNRIGLGTTAPTARLEVNNGTTNGALKIVDGTQAAGRVLTSDANGLATWTDGGLTAWTLKGNSGITASTSAIGSTVNNNFLGSINSADLVLAANNKEAMRITTAQKVLIGTITVPTGGANAKVIINSGTSGALQIKDGTQADGYLLTSDANGVATWQANASNTLVKVQDQAGQEILPVSGTADAYYFNNKVMFATKELDPNNWFSNGKFQPTIPGYYFVSVSLRPINVDNGDQLGLRVLKNWVEGSNYNISNNSPNVQVYAVADIIVGVSLFTNSVFYLNGTSDYVEVYFSNTNGSNTGSRLQAVAAVNYFTAFKL